MVQVSLLKTLSGGVSIWMGDLKNIPLRSTKALDRKFYFNANKCELSKVQILRENQGVIAGKDRRCDSKVKTLVFHSASMHFSLVERVIAKVTLTRSS